MAKITSAVKRAKQAEANRVRNRAVKSTVLTATKKVREAVAAGNKDEAKKLLSAFSSTVDKAAKKGVVPKNTASRKKSRLALSIGKMA
jgi:small subunit ribosomal protein S20